MKATRKIVLFISALNVATATLASDRAVLTLSGQPDVVFQETTLGDAASKIANHCMNAGWQITSQTTNQVVCEVPMGTMQSALTQMLIGNSYSTTPRSFVRVNIAQIGSHTRAQANAWVETQMAFGQVRQQPFSDDKTFNNLMGFLTGAGGQLPPGTRFPGNYIGIDGQPESDGRRVSIPVTKVFPGSPGAEAGLEVGDRILKVNGATFKNQEDFGKKLNKVGASVRYPLVILRDGKEQTLSVIARTRPSVGTPEYDALIQAAKSAAAHPPSQVVTQNLTSSAPEHQQDLPTTTAKGDGPD